MKLTDYETVKNETTAEYFGGNAFSVAAFEKKYAPGKGVSYVDAVKRVCDEVASVEDTEEAREYWANRWFGEIYDDWWHPAGSIMQGAGSEKNISLANCTTISLGKKDEKREWDSLEGIFRNTAYTVAKCAAYRQGLGVDFSRLRPKGLTVENSSNESTGPVHWMGFIDGIAGYVGQKGRRPAMLFSLSCDHPDVREFIEVKSDRTLIQNANISVQCTDGFYDAVLNDHEWTLSFTIPEVKKGEKVYVDGESAGKNHKKDQWGWYYVSPKHRREEVFQEKVRAADLMEAIARNMCNHGEPGVQNIDVAERMSNSDYVGYPVLSTNACCVTPDTPILTDMGHIEIKYCVELPTVVWNGIEYTTVTPFKAGENQPIYRVELSDGGFLKCTANHKWRIDGGDGELQIETRNLELGQVLWQYDSPEQHTMVPEDAGGIVDSRRYYDHGFLCGDVCYNENGLPDEKHVPSGREPLANRISWLNGWLDAAGHMVHSRSGFASIEVSGCDWRFMYDVKLMLMAMGVSSHLHKAHDRETGGRKPCSHRSMWRLCVSDEGRDKLQSLGLEPRQLDFESDTPVYHPPRKVTVVKKEFIGTDDVFCFTEPTNHTGCFNGIITGQSEQYLDREGLCILSSINCEKFSADPSVFKPQLETIGGSVNRFLDNVIEYELRHKKHATPHQRDALIQLRRTGAGFTNLAAWLFKSNLAYGSEKGNEAVEEFVKWYNYSLYKSSIKLGLEKGSFGAFDPDKMKKAPFIRRMMDEFPDLEFDTLRNVTCSSVAPTGTLSLLFRRSILSYGIEPAFGLYFWKRTRITGGYSYYFCVPRIVREIYADAGYPIPMDSDAIEDDWEGNAGSEIAAFIDRHRETTGIEFVPATEVSAYDKLELMSRVMKWVDSSISVTYMLPEDADWKDVYKFILEGWKKGVKSIAAFPDRKLYGIVSYVPFKELALKMKDEGYEMHPMNFSENELEALNMSAENVSVRTQSAPKRPKSLDADIYLVRVKGEKFIVAVGLLNGQPYEVFGGKANGFGIQKTCAGKLIKHDSNKYGLQIGNIEIEDFSKHFTAQEQTLFRLASEAMRHGIPLEYTVEQMKKSADNDEMFSLPASIARVLGKYIKNGQTVSGKSCPSCEHSPLVYQDGCCQCPECGWSQCS